MNVIDDFIKKRLPSEEPFWHHALEGFGVGPYVNMPFTGYDEDGYPIDIGEKGSGVGLDHPMARKPDTEMTMEQLTLLNDIIALSNPNLQGTSSKGEIFGMPIGDFESMTQDNAHAMIDSLIMANDLSSIMNDPHAIDSWSQWGISGDNFPMDQEPRNVSFNPYTFLLESFDVNNPMNEPIR